MFKLKGFKIKNFLILLLLSTKTWGKNEQDFDFNKIFNKEEVALMSKNSDKFYVYLSKDFIKYLNNLEVTKDTHKDLISMKDHVKTYKSADYDFTLSAVNSALKDCKNEKDLQILNSYKESIESGDAILNLNNRTKGNCNKKKCFCKLVVKEKAVLGSLDVKHDTNLNNLTVTGATNLSNLTTIAEAYPVKDPSESVSILRSVFKFPSNIRFSARATLSSTALGNPAIVEYSIDGGNYEEVVPVSEVTRTSGHGISIANIPDAVSFQKYTDLSGTSAYTNYVNLDVTNPEFTRYSDFIHIPILMAFEFEKPFSSVPVVYVSSTDVSTAVTHSRFNGTLGSGALLIQIFPATAFVTETGFFFYLTMGFAVNAFSDSSSKEGDKVTLSGISDVINTFLPNLTVNVTAIG